MMPCSSAEQADSIAEKIRSALEALGLYQSSSSEEPVVSCSRNRHLPALPPGASASSSGPSATSPDTPGRQAFGGLDLIAGGPLLIAAAAAGVPEPLLGTLSGLSQAQQDLVEQHLLQDQGL